MARYPKEANLPFINFFIKFSDEQSFAKLGKV